jgi:hypothetical protein
MDEVVVQCAQRCWSGMFVSQSDGLKQKDRLHEVGAAGVFLLGAYDACRVVFSDQTAVCARRRRHRKGQTRRG